MKTGLYVLGFILVLITLSSAGGKGTSCTCRDLGYFCEYVSDYDWPDISIVLGTATRKYEFVKNGYPIPLLDFKIDRTLSGRDAVSTSITFIGHDGGNCNADLFHIQEGDTLVVIVPEPGTSTNYYDFPDTSKVYKDLLGCGSSYLRRKGDLLVQDHPWRTTGMPVIKWNSFFENFESCTRLTLNSSLPALITVPTHLLYPNPTDNSLFVKSEEEVHEIHLYAVSGQEFRLQSTRYNEFDVSDLPRGIFFVLWQGSDAGRSTNRVVLVD